MYQSQVILILVICVFINILSISSCTSCEQKICREDMIFCLDVAVPSFSYRPTIARLYLERVQLLEIANILASLPNLKYISLVDMKNFSCIWLEDIPTNVVVLTNMCLATSPTHLSTSGKKE